MSYKRNITSKIHRLGHIADVLDRQETGTDRFNNPESDWSDAHDVITLRTYPNRNTEVKNRDGDKHRDRPVFLFPRNQESNLPEKEGRIRYPAETGRVYEMQAPTYYDTHIEMFGEIVTDHPDNDDDGEIIDGTE